MAKNLIYKYTESKTRVRVLAANTESGKPVLDPQDSRPAVTLTGTGTQNNKVLTNAVVPLGGGVVSVTYNEPGGASLVGREATLAYDGTWEFDAITTGTTPAPTSTAQGAQVYITSGGEISTSATSNTAYGRVDYPTDYNKRAGKLPVRIGD